MPNCQTSLPLVPSKCLCRLASTDLGHTSWLHLGIFIYRYFQQFLALPSGHVGHAEKQCPLSEVPRGDDGKSQGEGRGGRRLIRE